VLDLSVRSTSPVYVTVGGKPLRSAEDADYFLAWIDRVREEVEQHGGWNTPAEREQVLATIARARAEYQRRK
jgi:hypothetical protein